MIISLDSNEHIRTGHLARSFRRLGLVDSITAVTSASTPDSHINGSKPLDAIWVSSDIEVATASICPHTFSVGYHRDIMIDISRSSLLGSRTIPLLPTKMRRLISSNSRSVHNYMHSCHEGTSDHKSAPKLNVLVCDWNDMSQEDIATTFNSIDGQLQIIMTCAEKKFRKLRAGAM